MLVEARLESRDRLKTRRIERQVVQFKANQAMQEAETEEIGEISQQAPELFQSLATKRTVDFKDPGAEKKKPNT